MPLRLEVKARAGGMGGGNLPNQEFGPPEKWIPRIIFSGDEHPIQNTKIQRAAGEIIKPIKTQTREESVSNTGWGFLIPIEQPLHKRVIKWFKKRYHQFRGCDKITVVC